MRIRNYGEGDARGVAEVYYGSIRRVCIRDYTPEEIDAWAPLPIDYDKWRRRCETKRPFVAEHEGRVVGFCELEADGHIDCFYVHPDTQRMGIAKALMERAVAACVEAGVPRMYAEVSRTARGFFENRGFRVVRENEASVRGQILVNFIMERFLDA